MAQVHTHYDNLKVARNAPPEVIRAAYRTLSQKFHPDRNPENAEYARIMAIINTSYEVLSDPDKRREHDQWITGLESATKVNAQSTKSAHETTQQPPHSLVFFKPFLPVFNLIKGLVIWVFSYAIGIGVLVGVIWLIGSSVDFFGGKSTPPLGPKPYQANPTPVRSEYVMPSTAPNGQPWPVAAGYVLGYKKLHADGLSTVTVDNSQNDSNVFVKLVSLNSAQAYPARQFYIPAFGSFTLNKITAGNYDIRYRDLTNGGLSRSEAFNLEEISTYNGTQFSNITMTLYKVQNGNLQTYDLSESEF